MGFFLHKKLAHFRKLSSKDENSVPMLQNSDNFPQKLSFSEILCMGEHQKSGQKKEPVYGFRKAEFLVFFSLSLGQI